MFFTFVQFQHIVLHRRSVLLACDGSSNSMLATPVPNAHNGRLLKEDAHDTLPVLGMQDSDDIASR